MDVRKVAYWFRKHHSKVRIAREALDALYKAKDGGALSAILAWSTIVGNVLDSAIEDESLYEFMHKEGYRLINTPIRGFLAELLTLDTLPTRTSSRSSNEIRYWGDNEEIAAVYSEDTGSYYRGPFTKGSDTELLMQFIARNAWTHPELLLVEDKEQRYNPGGQDRFSLAPLPELGPYISKKPIDYYVNRIKRYGNSPRTILIEGPTRVGKSVLARNIAKKLSDESGFANTLKIDGTSLMWWNPTEIKDIVRYLRPNILLIDDIDMRSSFNLLSILESLRIEGSIVFITRMIDTGFPEERRPGDRYIEGMGPGRIDEIFTLYRHDAEERDMILRYYYNESNIIIPKAHAQIVEATEGLTGGYLSEIVKRLDVHGEENWEEEVRNVLYFAPPPPIKEEEEEQEESPEESSGEAHKSKTRPCKPIRSNRNVLRSVPSHRYQRGVPEDEQSGQSCEAETVEDR